MEKQSKLDKLAGYLIILGIIAIVAVLCWYFSNVLTYIILAFIVSLVSIPLVRLMQKIRIKGKCAPAWLLAIIAIILVIAILLLVIIQIIPVIVNIINDASLFSGTNSLGDVGNTINSWIVSLFPSLGEDFNAVSVLLEY